MPDNVTLLVNRLKAKAKRAARLANRKRKGK